MWFTALLFAALAAGCGGGGGGQGAILAPPGLVSIAVTPATASVPIGGTQQFTATATFSDGSTKNVTTSSTWSSATTGVATVVPTTGVATGVAPGASVITATYGGKTGTATLTVTNAAVVSIAVTPLAASVAINGVQQFTALATYSDGTTNVDVTATSTWNSATPAVAANPIAGLATGLTAGTTLITASLNGVTSPPATLTVTNVTLTLASIAVTPATALISATGTQQYTATATYTDTSTAIVTLDTSWSSGDVAPWVGGVATIDNTVGSPTRGRATGVKIGTSLITASYTAGGITKTATATLNVTVNLRRANTFAVLSGTTLTNAGVTTVVNGNVGEATLTNTGTINVDPGFFNYLSPAVPFTDAITDLPLAIADANTPACTTSYVGAQDFAGVIFTPGVICVSGAINNTGILTLNTPGVYIFRTTAAGALTPAATGSVAFGAGVTNANTSVFWVPTGATSITAGASWKGTIMSSGVAIDTGAGNTLANGRVLTTGPVTLSTNTITRPVP